MKGFSVGFPEVFHFKTPNLGFTFLLPASWQALKLFSAGFFGRILSILLLTDR